MRQHPGGVAIVALRYGAAFRDPSRNERDLLERRTP